MKMGKNSVLFIVLLLTKATLFGHIPFFDSKVITDIWVAQVHNYEVTKPATVVVDLISKGEVLYLVFAVPKLERLRNFRPKVSLVSPLNEIVESFDTSKLEATVFHERFTNTYSWVFYRREHRTVRGTYRLFIECETPGRFWIAVGREERFDLLDFEDYRLRLNRIRQFHE